MMCDFTLSRNEFALGQMDLFDPRQAVKLVLSQ